MMRKNSREYKSIKQWREAHLDKIMHRFHAGTKVKAKTNLSLELDTKTIRKNTHGVILAGLKPGDDYEVGDVRYSSDVYKVKWNSGETTICHVVMDDEWSTGMTHTAAVIPPKKPKKHDPSLYEGTLFSHASKNTE